MGEKIKIKPILLALPLLFLPFFPIKSEAAASQKSYTITICVQKNSPILKDKGYQVAPDNSVSVAVYKKGVSDSNLANSGLISRDETQDSSDCIAYKGQFSTNYDPKNDNPIIVQSEVPVYQTDGGLAISTKETKYSELKNFVISMNIDASSLVLPSKSKLYQGGDIDKYKKQGFDSIFGVYCPADSALTCWMGAVFNFSQTAIWILSVGAIVAAGVLWMTSSGNPARVTQAKKLIVGALSAVAIIVLGKFFLEKVIGVTWIIK